MARSETSARIDEIEISIQRRVKKLSPPSDCSIFTVPEKFRKSNREAYTPRVLAIGPYHRHTRRLKPMEDHKLRYWQHFFRHNPRYLLKDYIERVKSWENKARNCYDKHIDLSPKKFAEMMLLDGIFVIQLFLMSKNNSLRLQGDWIFDKPHMLNDVRRDMALLENQMPFFVIQQLFYMAFGTHQRPMELLELVCLFFNPTTGMEKLPELEMESDVKHFVDVIRLSFLCSLRMAPNECHMKTKFTPSATELVAAGVKLRKGNSKCLFNVEFKNGVLTIPKLTLYDSTESFFRNIIVFEQFYHYDDRYLVDYMAFMDYLVDTPGDAKLLIDKKIIDNWLSNKEAVADLINAFCKEATLSEPNYYFNSLSHELRKHCKKPHNRWKATFKRDYCSSPWAVISVIAAVVLLLLTIAQTVCSFFSLK